MTTVLPETSRPAATTGSRPVLFRLVSEPDHDGPGPPVRAAGSTSRSPASAPRPRVAPPPDPTATIAAVLRLLVEVFDGHRPSAQLRPHLDDGPLHHWRAVTSRRRAHPACPARDRHRVRRATGPSALARSGSRTRCGPVHRSHPRPDVAEVAVCLRFDGQARALAARFECTRSRGWRCTVLRLY